MVLDCRDAAGNHLSLKNLFDASGSDKSLGARDYSVIYAHIIDELGGRSSALRTCEIGLGTNNTKVLSTTMGAKHTPGASQRALRNYLPNGRIHAADIDPSILFREERIETTLADQLSLQSLDALHTRWGPQPFDLVVDDGLHNVGANINTLLFGLRHVRRGEAGLSSKTSTATSAQCSR